MFIIRKASSSRIPNLQPTLSTCINCRSFNSSSVNLVKRPQKPYEAPLAKIDAYGNRIPIEFINTYDDREGGGRGGKAELNKSKFLEALSDSRSKSNLEKYGNSREFGLRRSSRNDKDLYEADVEGEEENDWKSKIGIKSNHANRNGQQIKLGRRKFERANESYLEESKRLNPYKLQNQNDYKATNNKLKSSKQFSKDNNSTNQRLFQEKRNIQDKAQLSKQFLDQNVDNQLESDYRNKNQDSPSNSSSRFRNNDDPKGQDRLRSDRERESSLKSYGTPKKRFGLSSNSPSYGNSEREGRYNNHNPPPTPTETTSTKPTEPKSPEEYWKPTKKLTYSAMAGLKTLYSIDSEKYSKEFLSQKFGISREAVNRILKSKYRSKDSNIQGEQGEGNGEGGLLLGNGKTAVGTKWDRNPNTSEGVSPVPAILRAFGRD